MIIDAIQAFAFHMVDMNHDGRVRCASIMHYKSIHTIM